MDKPRPPAAAGRSYIVYIKLTCKQHLDSRCILLPHPSTFGSYTPLTYVCWIRGVFCYRVPAPARLVPGVPTKPRLHTPKAVTYHEQSQFCDIEVYTLLTYLCWIRSLHPSDLLRFSPQRQGSERQPDACNTDRAAVPRTSVRPLSYRAP